MLWVFKNWAKSALHPISKRNVFREGMDFHVKLLMGAKQEKQKNDIQ